MYSIIVNGQSETCETNKKLMDFLREDLGLLEQKMVVTRALAAHVRC